MNNIRFRNRAKELSHEQREKLASAMVLHLEYLERIYKVETPDNKVKLQKEIMLHKSRLKMITTDYDVHLSEAGMKYAMNEKDNDEQEENNNGNASGEQSETKE